MDEQMRQTGKVMAVNGKTATVRFLRSDACGHCNACFRFGSNESDIDLPNTQNAAVGDTVEIELHGASILKASAITYGIPLIGLVAGVAIGSRFGDVFAVLGGLLLCGACYLLLRALEPKFSRMDTFKPRMISIIETKGEQ